jgi:predicted PolB exonuclease-like 3'-5' exonuclease
MAFAIFDIETRIDKRLLKQIFFPGDELGEEEAYQKFSEEYRGGFLPTSLHIPISIAVGEVGPDYVLRAIENLAASDYSEEKLVREFWAHVERFSGCMVSFNGRRFDFPVLELQALRFGISAPAHFAEEGGGRHRHSEDRHLDLMDFLSNYGAFSIRGGLDLLLKMIGLPGKGKVDGSNVQEIYEKGQLAEIHRYCRNDVIQTYFLFLRVQFIRGKIDETIYKAAQAGSAPFLGELKQP